MVRRRKRDIVNSFRVARGSLDLDQPFLDLRHFELEKAPDEIWVAPRDNNFRSANSIFHRDDIGAQPITDVVILDDDAFFATLREAVHDDTPLGRDIIGSHDFLKFVRYLVTTFFFLIALVALLVANGAPPPALTI